MIFAEQRRDPGKDRLLRLLMDHENVSIGTIPLAVAAADAVALDVHLAARIADDRVGRTVEHAHRVLALPARIRRQQVVELDSCKRQPRLAIRVNAFTSGDAVAAADAFVLVDDERLRPHHHFFADQIIEDVARAGRRVSNERGDAALLEFLQRRLAQIGMRGQKVVEVALRQLDQIGRKDRRHGGGAIGIRKQRRLAEEVSGHEIRQHYLFVARLLRNLHHPVADQVEGIGFLPFLENDRIFRERVHHRQVDQLAELRLRNSGEEIAAERAQQKGLIDERPRFRSRAEEFEDGLARDFNQASRPDRTRGRRAAAAGDEAHLAEEVPRRQLGHLDLGIRLLRLLPQLDAAAGDDQEVVRVIVLTNDDLAVRVLTNARGEERLAKLLFVRRGEQRHALAQQRDALAHGAFPERQALLQHRLVRRLDFAAHEMLDDFVALIHPQLDEIAAAGRADEEESRHARLVYWAENRPRVFPRAAEGDADRLEKLARRVGAQLQKNQLRGDAHHVAAHGEVGVAGIDLLHARAEVNGQLSGGLAAEDFFDEHIVRTRDLRASDDEPDAVFIGKCDGDLQRGIAGADDEQILIAMFGRIDEAVANVRQILARYAELARITLRSHRQDDVCGVECVAAGGLHLKPAALLLHRLNLGVQDAVRLFLFNWAPPP